MSSSVQVKLYVQKQQGAKEIRKYLVPRQTDFDDLYNQIKESQPWVQNGRATLSYVDDEGDNVLLSTNADWKLALSTVKDGILRMKLSTNEPQRNFKPRNPMRNLFGLNREFVPAFNLQDLLQIFNPLTMHPCSRKSDEHPQQQSSEVHFGVVCDGCEQRDIKGNRFKCTECPDFDYCGRCYNDSDIMNSHGNHKFERVTQKPFDAFQHCAPRMGPGRSHEDQPKLEDFFKLFGGVHTNQEASQDGGFDLHDVIKSFGDLLPKQESEKAQPEKQTPKLSLEEQLKELSTMGFTDVDKCKDLLSRYNGNLNRVVEVLLQQRGF